VTNIVLNPRGLLTAVVLSGRAVIRIEKDGEEGKITAGDDIIPHRTARGAEIPDHPCAHVFEGRELRIELQWAPGRGYVPAERTRPRICRSASSPSTRWFSADPEGHFQVHERARRSADRLYDRLQTSMGWTNGAVKPEDPCSPRRSSRTHLSIFITSKRAPSPLTRRSVSDEQANSTRNLWNPSTISSCSGGSANGLQTANIRYIGELVQRTDPRFSRRRTSGPQVAEELKEILA